MPAYLTHYLYGRINYHRMAQGKVKDLIRRHRAVYALGLAGPDIFFYFVPDYILTHPTAGSIMHEEECGRFLRRMLTESLAADGEERETALAYLAGFIGHYRLDHACHPLVYEYVDREAERLNKSKRNSKNAIHFRLECALDHYFLEHYAGKSTADICAYRVTAMSRKEKKCVSRLLADSYNKTYACPNMTVHSVGGVLTCVQAVLRLIRDKLGRKESVYCLWKRIVHGEPWLEGLFMNDNCYDIDRREWEKFDKEFRNAMKICRQDYRRLEDLLNAESKEDFRAKKKIFCRKLGDWSYHTAEKSKNRAFLFEKSDV